MDGFSKFTSYRKRIRLVFWFLAVVLGAFYILTFHQTTNPDGISYLDKVDTFWMGELATGCEVLESSIRFVVGFGAACVSCVTPLGVFCCALSEFLNLRRRFGVLRFLLESISSLRRARRDHAGVFIGLPEWAWFALGYSCNRLKETLKSRIK